MVYVEKEKARLISEEEIKQFLTDSDYYKKKIKEVAKKTDSTEEYILNQAVGELFKLNWALISGFEVWADLEKYPRNLDSGKHWFQIWYTDIVDNKPIRYHFWSLLFMDKNKDTSCYGWGFSSSVIGMSRKLDATDNVFSLLKRMGGAYAQL